MDQYVEQARRAAVQNLCSKDKIVADYCHSMEEKFSKQSQSGIAPSVKPNEIQFDSQDYHNQLRLYVQEINPSNFQQLDYKLKTLFQSLRGKEYSR